ncbi:MAG: phage holin family protein [Burkholderiales bacterium]
MGLQSSTDAFADPAAPSGSGTGGAAWREDAQSLWEAVRGLTHDQLQLAALETTLAGQSLVTMIAAGVIVAVLLVSAWLGLETIGVLLLIQHGVFASVAVLAVVGVNLALALILYAVIRRKCRNLRFPATLRSLRPRTAGQRIDEETR